MSEIFSSGSRRASRANLNHGINEDSGSVYHDGYVFPTRRRMRRAQQDIVPVNGRQDTAGGEDVQPHLSRRARRDLNDRREYEGQLVRDYFRAGHGAEVVPRNITGQPAASMEQQRSLPANASERNLPLQALPGTYPGQQQRLPELDAAAGVTARAQEHVKELLQAQQQNAQALYAYQRSAGQAQQQRTGNSSSENRGGQPMIRDSWSLPVRKDSQVDDNFAGYLPGKQKVFIDPTASDNLAMVQPADYVHISGRSGSVMKSPVTSSIPVITANQPVVRDSPSGRSLHDLRSSRSSLLARAEQIASNSNNAATGTVNIDAVGARLQQEQRLMTAADHQWHASPGGASSSAAEYARSFKDSEPFYAADTYAPSSERSYSRPEQASYPGYSQDGEENNPPLASGEARGIQPINTKTAGSKSRVEKIATIVVTAGISLVFSVVVISIFFMK